MGRSEVWEPESVALPHRIVLSDQDHEARILSSSFLDPVPGLSGHGPIGSVSLSLKGRIGILRDRPTAAGKVRDFLLQGRGGLMQLMGDGGQRVPSWISLRWGF